MEVKLLRLEYQTLENIPAIYIFRNTINGKFYIGETINLKRRMVEYLYPLRKGRDRVIHSAIKKYGIDNFSFEFYYLPTFKKNDLLILERTMIEIYKSLRPTGYNICIGGTDFRGVKHTETTKKKMSVSKSKEVHKYHPLTGKFVETYSSVDAAANSVNGNPSNISLAALGNRKSAHGLLWSYDKSNYIEPVDKIGVTTAKTILQKSLNGDILNSFPSLRKAASFVNGTHNNICNACNKRAKTAYGYIWDYQ